MGHYGIWTCLHPGFGHVAHPAAWTSNFVPAEIIRRPPGVQSSSTELPPLQAFNRSGTSRRIAPNIRVFIFLFQFLSKQRKVKSVMKLYSKNNFPYLKKDIFLMSKRYWSTYLHLESTLHNDHNSLWNLYQHIFTSVIIRHKLENKESSMHLRWLILRTFFTLAPILGNWRQKEKLSEMKPPLDKYSFCTKRSSDVSFIPPFKVLLPHLLQNHDSYIEKFDVFVSIY